MTSATPPLPSSEIQEAIKLLKKGGLIGFPTETYYGLGVDPFNEKALRRLFSIKQRSPKKAVLVLVADQSQVSQLAESIPADFNKLMSAFWPGSLTLVFPGQPHLPKLLTGADGTIGIRQSPNPIARQLLDNFAGPLTATSANRSGAVPATTAAEVKDIFGSKIDLILGKEPTPGGQGSTIVGYNQGIYCIRAGTIPFTDIQNTLSD